MWFFLRGFDLLWKFLSDFRYTKKYGSTEIVSKRFQCLVCASEMKFCRQNIYAHMKVRFDAVVFVVVVVVVVAAAVVVVDGVRQENDIPSAVITISISFAFLICFCYYVCRNIVTYLMDVFVHFLKLSFHS